MATSKQKETARRNIGKARQAQSARAHAETGVIGRVDRSCPVSCHQHFSVTQLPACHRLSYGPITRRTLRAKAPFQRVS